MHHPIDFRPPLSAGLRAVAIALLLSGSSVTGAWAQSGETTSCGEQAIALRDTIQQGAGTATGGAGAATELTLPAQTVHAALVGAGQALAMANVGNEEACRRFLDEADAILAAN